MKKALIVGGTFALLLVPLVGLAANSFLGPIVPDDFFKRGPYLRGCDVAILFDSVLKFAVGFTVFAATLMFTYAGFLYVTASSNADNIKKATEIFSTVAFGLFWVLAAWLIINIIMSVLTDQTKYPWDTIKCVEYREVPQKVPGAVEAGAGQPLPPGTLAEGTAALLLAQNGIGVSSTGNCADRTNASCTALAGMQPKTIDDLIAFRQALGEPVTVTAGTEVGHQNQCHQNGTCLDFSVSSDVVGSPGNYNANNINNIIEQARSVDRCIVFEPPQGASCPTGVTSCQEYSVTKSSGTHFSFYSCGN